MWVLVLMLPWVTLRVQKPVFEEGVPAKEVASPRQEVTALQRREVWSWEGGKLSWLRQKQVKGSPALMRISGISFPILVD